MKKGTASFSEDRKPARPCASSEWRRRAGSNRRIAVLQTAPLATWVRRLIERDYNRIVRSGSNLPEEGHPHHQAGLSRTSRSGYNPSQLGAVPKWLREQSAKLRCGGSIPPGASTHSRQRIKGFCVFFLLVSDRLSRLGHGCGHGFVPGFGRGWPQ